MKNYTQFKGSNPFGSQAKMVYHCDRLAEFMADDDTVPVMMEINLTSVCNLRCKWCISENFIAKDSLDTDALIKFLAEYKRAGGKAVTFSGGGEPTVHKDFIVLLSAADALGFEVGLMTNGTFRYGASVIGKIAKWIRVSLDTLDVGRYKEWKGVDLVDRAVANIKELKSCKAKVGVNCNIGMEHTKEDVDDLIDFAKEYADYIQFRPIIPRYFKSEPPELNEEIWAYLQTIDDSFINLSDDKLDDIRENNLGFPFDSCEGHHFCCVVDSNGDLTTCMYHPRDDRFVFGNIYQNSFQTIWNGEKRQKVKSFLRNNLNMELECQPICKLYELNKFIQFVKNPDPKTDINFL